MRLLLQTSWFPLSKVWGLSPPPSIAIPCPVFQQAAAVGDGGLGVDLGGGGRSGRRGPVELGELSGCQLCCAEEESSSPTHEGGAGKQVSV